MKKLRQNHDIINFRFRNRFVFHRKTIKDRYVIRDNILPQALLAFVEAPSDI